MLLVLFIVYFEGSYQINNFFLVFDGLYIPIFDDEGELRYLGIGVPKFVIIVEGGSHKCDQDFEQ